MALAQLIQRLEEEADVLGLNVEDVEVALTLGPTDESPSDLAVAARA
jgi:hypothetical protein